MRLRRPLGGGRRRAGALAALAALVLTGCGTETVTGQGAADESALAAQEAAVFEERMALLDEAALASFDLVGTSFNHAEYGDARTDRQTFVAKLGDPPALFLQQSSSTEGDQIDSYHPAGSDRDYLLLGDAYVTLAPTRWVSVPTSYPADALDVCVIEGLADVCRMSAALAETMESDAAVGVPQQVFTRDDGSTQLVTAITVDSALAQPGLIDLSSEVTSQFDEEILQSLIPLSVWQDAEGLLTKIELSGQVDGDTPLLVQTGFEVSGVAVEENFPQPPSPLDITLLDGGQYQALRDAVTQIRASL